MATRALKIFIVENHDDTLTYLSKYLKGCGHEVQCAKGMGRAWEILSSLHFDVLIRNTGYRHHLIKPFLPEELDVLIEEAAGEK